MSPYLLCVFIFTLASAQLSEENFKKFQNDCMVENGLSEEDLINSRPEQYPEITVLPKLKKFTLCFLTKVGIMDESGEIVVDVLKNNILKNVTSDKVAAEIVTKCVVVKDSPAETAYELNACIENELDQHEAI